jgi:hypothetical protein
LVYAGDDLLGESVNIIKKITAGLLDARKDVLSMKVAN